MAQTVELNVYGMELVGAKLDASEISLDELTGLLSAETSADGETSTVVDGRNVLYRGQVIGRVMAQSRPGTAPDTSLFLGPDRKGWLAEQGGIQPTIQRMVDDMMGVQPVALAPIWGGRLFLVQMQYEETDTPQYNSFARVSEWPADAVGNDYHIVWASWDKTPGRIGRAGTFGGMRVGLAVIEVFSAD